MQSVSIIVCSHNGSHRLPLLLGSLGNLTLDPRTSVELVFVDSASEDDTLDLVKRSNLPFPLKWRRLSEPGQSKALNCAVEMSIGTLLLFTDDDCQPESQWVSAYVNTATREVAAGYFFGRIVAELPPSRPDWWEELAPRSIGGRDQGLEPVVYPSFCRESYPIGCNMAVRRSVLSRGLRFCEKLGPHPKSPTWLGADIRLGRDIQAIGFTGCYVPGAIVYHRVQSERLSLQYLFAHSLASGRASLYYKPADSQYSRLCFALECLLRFFSQTCVAATQLIFGNGTAGRRSQLSAIKAAGSVWEYTRTFGGNLR